MYPHYPSPFPHTPHHQNTLTQFTLPEALKVLKSDWMREAIIAWAARRGWDTTQLDIGELHVGQLHVGQHGENVPENLIVTQKGDGV